MHKVMHFMPFPFPTNSPTPLPSLVLLLLTFLYVRRRKLSRNYVLKVSVSLTTASPCLLKYMPKFIDPVEGFAGAAILCTALGQHIYSSHVQSEIASETICWLILPFLFRFTKPRETNRFSSIPRSQSKPQSSSSFSLWIVAACISIASVYRAEIGVIGLLPALTPLLLIAEKRLRSEWQASRVLDAQPFYPLVHTIWGTASAATFAIVVLSDWSFDFTRLAISIILVAALLVLYTALTARPPGVQSFVSVDFEKAIVPLAQLVAIILGAFLVLQVFIFGISGDAILPAILLGVVKALSWYLTARTTRYTSWLVATAMITFSIMSTRDPFMQPSGFQAISHVLGSILALSQIICMLQKLSKSPSILWGLILISLVPYVRNEYAIRVSQAWAPSTFDDLPKHPAEILILKAQEDFKTMLDRQSKHYAYAITHYRRRYKIEPPPGYRQWFDYAESVHSPIIDNFDMIFEQISPFLKISGMEYIKAMNEAQNAPNAELWRCTFASTLAQTRCKHPYRTNDRHYSRTFNALLKDSKNIPDMDFLINHLDEPRVVIPPSQGGRSTIRSKITDLSHQSTWTALTSFCPPPDNHTTTEPVIETYGIPFVTNLTTHQNLCLHPAYAQSYGMLLSPTSFYPISGLSPVLSTGALSTMGDILFPSPAYSESEFLYTPTADIPWSQKSNSLYWAGSTTGGYATSSNWKSFQRQRFVTIAQNLKRGYLYTYLYPLFPGTLTPMYSSFLNSRLYNVAFTKIFQCTTSTCRAQRLFFPPKPWADKDAAMHHKLVFDIDGNGISGRYYKLLASNSLPLKQTLLKEWHDERLVPWRHYVPVSQEMEELPELVRWFTSDEVGRRRAEEIAEEGRKWAQKALRKEDMSVYLYRLMLELARLQDVGRVAS